MPFSCLGVRGPGRAASTWSVGGNPGVWPAKAVGDASHGFQVSKARKKPIKEINTWGQCFVVYMVAVAKKHLLSILLRSIFGLKKNDFERVVASWRGLSCCLIVFSSGWSMPCFSYSFRNRFRATATPLIKGTPWHGANLTWRLTAVKTWNENMQFKAKSAHHNYWVPLVFLF